MTTANPIHPPRTTAGGSGGVRRQVNLPMSKAVEIAYKSIRLRLSRSLLVTSGIVLALAFLMSILAGDALVNGMRGWITEAKAPDYAPFKALREDRQRLDRERTDLARRVLDKTHAATAAGAAKGEFDAEKAFGATLPDLAKEVGRLPAPQADLAAALAADATVVSLMRQWVDQGRQVEAIKAKLNGPQDLESIFAGAGIPTTATDIANAKTQTRWLLGLALLVAFVGILNAMLMSVTERFREIGTMKCLGALDSFIIRLFLIESLFQGIVGTIIGVLVGLLLSLVSAMTTYGRTYAFVNVPWGEIGVGVVTCVAVGIGLTVAGAVYPAWQAARMQPIEAMRVET
ncbi:MAG TPA: FtsX-like permease family protein [Tepidisphaeraceae bacterium]|nr:FtsX-like permease family protein [Tepidisphaeraceae bacterium]